MESLLGHWLELVSERPDHAILHDPERQRWITVYELDKEAREKAELLEAMGLAGRTIAFVEPNGGDWLATFLAILLGGGVAVPLEADQCPDDLNALVAMRCHALWRDKVLKPVCKEDFPLPSEVHLAKVTSGSTGVPKLLFLKDAEMLADGRNIIRTMGFQETDVHYVAIPFGHSYGLGNLLMPLILQGAPVVVASEIFPQVMLEEMRFHGVTVFPAVPALLRGLALSPGTEEVPRRLRCLISAGAPLDRDVVKAFHARFGLPIHNFYGSSETGGICYDRLGDDGNRAAGVGTPLKGVMLQCLADGSLSVRSEAVYSHQNPSSSWFPLPDIGRIEADGTVHLIGRRRSFLKVGARRLDPGEVESAAKAIAGVTFAWCSTYASKQGERVGLLFSGKIEITAIRKALAEGLPPWKRPSRIRRLDHVPRTARGKVSAKAMQGRLDAIR